MLVYASMAQLTLWQSPLDHIHYEPHRKLAVDYYFPFLPFPRQTDLPRPPNIQAPVSSDQLHTLRIHKTNLPLGRYGPSYGPPSLARHGGGTSDSAFTHWLKQGYEIWYSAKLLHRTSKVIKLQQLSFPSPGGASQHESQSEHEVDFLTHS